MDWVLHESTQGMVGTGGEPGWKIYWSARKQIPKALHGSQGTAEHRSLSCGTPVTVAETQHVAAAPCQLGKGVRRNRGALAPGCKEAEPSVVGATSESCLWPTKDELGKKNIVMLIVCTKVMRSCFVLVPPPCCSVAGGYK